MASHFTISQLPISAARIPSLNHLVSIAIPIRPVANHLPASPPCGELHESLFQRRLCKEEEYGVCLASCSKRGLLHGFLAVTAAPLIFSWTTEAQADEKRAQFYDLEGSGGVKALDIREGAGETPRTGDKVAIHYYARLAAKQGWRFDSTYDHKDETGAPEPYVFTIGSGTVISGLDAAVRSMKEGGVRRVVIPPSQGYLNTMQGPIPPNFFDRQRLYTTIFNPTRIANGEGSTLGTLIFDIELLRIRSS